MALPLELASPFSEHMVMQRDMPVPVWGWGESGAKVDVSIAGRTATTTVATDGSWKLTLPPMEAGGPFAFTVSSGEDVLHFKDVLVGEVWICSGQSNMQFGRARMLGVEKMMEDAKGRPIRSMSVRTDVSFTPHERFEGKWTASPSSSAVAFAFSLHLQEGLGDVPVGVIVTCWGSSSIEGWMPLDMTVQLPHFKAQMKTFEKKDREKVAKLIKDRAEGKKWPKKENIYLRTRPNILYNAMLHPLIPYASRGMLWYQGEANTKSISSMRQYGESIKLWCQRLRKAWGQDDFHLLAVMLPRLGSSGMDAEAGPRGKSWAWMRESQLQLLELPHTGVAVTVDLGDPKNVHPRDKGPVGARAALLALRDVNGKKLEAQGPTFAEAVVGEKSIRVRFDHANDLTTTDGKAPRSFWVAGSDEKWAPAKAKIQGESLILTSAEVANPRFVRYAFVGAPDVNLINRAKLPAAPFRTDSLKP